ncbi:MAG: hypothetical protein ACXACT_16425 [Candidatus Thorarchaeota archaeon]|jgi:hypothetical protein
MGLSPSPEQMRRENFVCSVDITRKEVIHMAVCPKTGKRGVPLWHLLVAVAVGLVWAIIVNHF